MPITHQVSQRIFSKEQAELGKHARDVQDIFNKIPVVVHKVVEQPYDEPMTIGNLTEEPFSIELVRVSNLSQATQIVSTATSLVHFTWQPNKGGLVINKIGGMSVGTSLPTLRFYFRITYKME
jgi:hypothetical protein